MEDFVGFSVLSLESDPVFFLSVSILDRDNVIVVYEFSDSLFLGFPAIFGKAFGGEKAVSVPGGKRYGGRIIREDSIRARPAHWGALGGSAAGLAIAVGGSLGSGVTWHVLCRGGTASRKLWRACS